MSRTEIAPELLDYIAGGAIGFDPEPSGTYTMRCEFSGEVCWLNSELRFPIPRKVNSRL